GSMSGRRRHPSSGPTSRSPAVSSKMCGGASICVCRARQSATRTAVLSGASSCMPGSSSVAANDFGRRLRCEARGARKKQGNGPYLVDGRGVDGLQLAGSRDCRGLAVDIDDIQAEQLLLRLRDRAKLSLPGEPIVNLAKVRHERGVLLRSQPQDLRFRVVRENGVEHDIFPVINSDAFYSYAAVPHAMNSVMTNNNPHSTIRRAGPEDAPTLASLGTATFTETFGHLYPPEDLHAFLGSSHSVDAWTRILRDPQRAVWLAALGGARPVGYIAV